VDSLFDEEISAYRGMVTKPGQPSSYRDRSVEENLGLLHFAGQMDLTKSGAEAARYLSMGLQSQPTGGPPPAPFEVELDES
jgi:hypothetical protein